MSRSVFHLFIILFSLAACNSKDESTAAELSLPPFKQITDSIRQHPLDDALYFRRAVLLNQNNLQALALSDFQHAWQIKKTEPTALGISSLLLDHKPDSALIFLREATSVFPNSYLLHISMARSYEAANQPAQAIAVYNSILQKDPEQFTVLMMKVDLLKAINDTTGLLPALELAHRLQPGNLDISYNLAYQYADRRMPQALALADSLIAADTLHNEAEPFYIKGYYYSGIGQDVKAIDLFNKTIQRDHNHLNALIEKGKIYFNEKKLKEAQQTFQLANTISPAFPDAYYWIGRCQEVNGLKEDAKLSYEKAYSLDKTFTEAKDAAAKLN